MHALFWCGSVRWPSAPCLRDSQGDGALMECCQEDCSVAAAVAVYWPSSKGPIPMCEPHAQRAVHVAHVMGFKLPIGDLMVLLEPLAQEVEEALDTCDLHGKLKPRAECDVCMRRGVWAGIP